MLKRFTTIVNSLIQKLSSIIYVNQNCISAIIKTVDSKVLYTRPCIATIEENIGLN